MHTSTGVAKTTNKIPLQEFRDWLTMTLDINTPPALVKTYYGDIILDHAYANKLYLRGIYLSPTGRGDKFKYGYNLHDGYTSSDRCLGDPVEGATAIAAIWGAALLEEARSGNDAVLLDKFNELWNGRIDYGETWCARRRERQIGRDMIELIRKIQRGRR